LYSSIIVSPWSENLKRKRTLGRQGVDGRIIMAGSVEKFGGKMWQRSIWPKIDTGGGIL
jgi:hypothetical protein